MPGIAEAKCVLVIGATAGIGRALALAIHDLPSRPTVIVSGRRQERIDELLQHGERIRGLRVDLTKGREHLRAFADDALAKFPKLDTVIYSSGIQHIFDFEQPEEVNLDLFEAELTTNYLSIVTLIKFFMPHFLKLSNKGLPSFIVPITSNLAVLPMPGVPGYCATKAALHSFALSLHATLKNTNVQVMEILPPLVESELHARQGSGEHLSRFWLPLNKFTEEAMEKLCQGGVQLPVGRAIVNWNRFEAGKVETILQVSGR